MISAWQILESIRIDEVSAGGIEAELTALDKEYGLTWSDEQDSYVGVRLNPKGFTKFFDALVSWFDKGKGMATAQKSFMQMDKEKQQKPAADEQQPAAESRNISELSWSDVKSAAKGVGKAVKSGAKTVAKGVGKAVAAPAKHIYKGADVAAGELIQHKKDKDAAAAAHTTKTAGLQYARSTDINSWKQKEIQSFYNRLSNAMNIYSSKVSDEDPELKNRATRILATLKKEDEKRNKERSKERQKTSTTTTKAQKGRYQVPNKFASAKTAADSGEARRSIDGETSGAAAAYLDRTREAETDEKTADKPSAKRSSAGFKERMGLVTPEMRRFEELMKQDGFVEKIKKLIDMVKDDEDTSRRDARELDYAASLVYGYEENGKIPKNINKDAVGLLSMIWKDRDEIEKTASAAVAAKDAAKSEKEKSKKKNPKKETTADEQRSRVVNSVESYVKTKRYLENISRFLEKLEKAKPEWKNSIDSARSLIQKIFANNGKVPEEADFKDIQFLAVQSGKMTRNEK